MFEIEPKLLAVIDERTAAYTLSPSHDDLTAECGCTGNCGQSCAGGCDSGCTGGCGRSCSGSKA